ncbi:MAG: uracil-DNA glycosylase [Acidobacteriota bacterium]
MDVLPEQQLRAYVEYLRDLGIYDLYRRDDPNVTLPEALREKLAALSAVAAIAPVVRLAADAARPAVASPVVRPAVAPRAMTPVAAAPVETNYFGGEPVGLPPELAAPMPKPLSFDALAPLPVQIVPAGERAKALEAVRAEIGDCTRCPLAYAGRHNIVFADGEPNARLMFVGEGPGADEDATGLPFVGKAGQLLNNMINAMGLKREEVYIANIVKCRPPGNRTPEFVEATTCSQFLVKQIDIVRPEVIVALGATAATYLLGVRQSLGSLRGTWHSVRGAKVAVTYHPAFLLRDPRQKGEAWKDLQRVMAELGLAVPKKSS